MKGKAATQAKEKLKKLQQEGLKEILHHVPVLSLFVFGITLVSVQTETETKQYKIPCHVIP